MMFCLLHQACHLRLNLCCIPQHSDDRIPGDANRIFPQTYCDPSCMSGFITKISLIFFYTGHLFLGVLFVPVVGTQFG